MSDFKNTKIDSDNAYSYIEEFFSGVIQESSSISMKEKEANERIKMERSIRLNENENGAPRKNRIIDYDDIWDAMEEDERPLNENDLKEGAHHYSVSEIIKVMKKKLYQDITNLKEYETFSKDAMKEHYDYYLGRLKKITSAVPENDNHTGRGVLENEFVKDIARLSEQDKKKIADLFVRDKTIYSEASLLLNEKSIKEYFANLSHKTFGTEFPVDYEPSERDVNKVYGNFYPLPYREENVVHTTLSLDGIISYAKQLQEIRETLSDRPWYKKLSGNYRHAKDAVVFAERTLINKGVDAKLLDKFVNAKGKKAENLLNQLIDKSSSKINDFIKENEEKLLESGLIPENQNTEMDLNNAKKTLESVNQIDFDAVDMKKEFEIEGEGEVAELKDSHVLREERSKNDGLFTFENFTNDKELKKPIEFTDEDLDEINKDTEDELNAFGNQADSKDDPEIEKIM